jgi:hypothetical protein
MILNSVYNTTRTPNILPTLGVDRAPLSDRDVYEANEKSARLNDQFDSERKAKWAAHDEARNELYRQIEQTHAGFKPGALGVNKKKYFNEPSPYLGGRFARTPMEAEYSLMAELAEESGVKMPDWDTYTAGTEERGREIASEAFDQAQIANIYGGGGSPRFAAAMGSLSGTIKDPALIGATLLTMPFMGPSGGVLRVFGAEALVGGTTEAGIQFKRHQWYADQGRDLSAQEMVAAVVLGAGFSGLIGAGVASIFKVLGTPNVAVWGVPGSLKHGPAAQVKEVVKKTNSGFGMEFDPNQQKFVRIAGEGRYKITAETMDISAEYGERGMNVAPTATLFDTAIDDFFPPGSTGRSYAQGAYNDVRLNEYNPGNGGKLDEPIRAADQEHFYVNTMELQRLHNEDLEQAIFAIMRGVAPAPQNTRQLAAHIALESPAEKRVNVQRLLEGRVKIDLKNPEYRKVINDIVNKAYRAKWQPTIDNMGWLLPADGSKAINHLQKPGGTFKAAEGRVSKLQADQRKANNDYADAVTEEIAWQKRLNEAQRAEGRGEEVPGAQVDELFKQGDAIHKRQVAAQQRVKDLQKKIDQAEAGLEEHVNYANAQRQVDNLNRVRDAKATIARLEDGKTPTSAEFKSMRKAADEAVRAARKAVRNEEMSAEIEFDEFLEPVRVRIEPWKLPTRELQAHQQADEMAQMIDDAAEAELGRLADDDTVGMTEGPDGKLQRISAKQLRDEIEQDDAIVEALSTCSTPGGGATE